MAIPRLKKRNKAHRCPSLLKTFVLAAFFLTKDSFADTQCARFIFPTLSSNFDVTVEENHVINLPFKLNTDQCPKSGTQDHYVYVSRHASDRDYCVVRLTENACSNTLNEKNCPCEKSGGAAVFTKTETDEGLWTWRTGDGVSEDVQLTFRILAANTSKASRQTDLPVSTHDQGISTASLNNDADVNMDTPRPSSNPTSVSETSFSQNDVTDDSVIDDADRNNKKKNDGTKTREDDGKDNSEERKRDDNRLGKKKSTVMTDDEDMGDKKDENDDNEDDGPLQGSVITGIVFAGVNIVTIAVVAFIVFSVRRRRKRKRRGTATTTERRRPDATRPLPPVGNPQYDVARPEPMNANRSSHSYQPLQGRKTSEIYDEIPAASGKECASDEYLTPVSKETRASQNPYDVVV